MGGTCLPSGRRAPRAGACAKRSQTQEKWEGAGRGQVCALDVLLHTYCVSSPGRCNERVLQEPLPRLGRGRRETAFADSRGGEGMDCATQGASRLTEPRGLAGFGEPNSLSYAGVCSRGWGSTGWREERGERVLVVGSALAAPGHGNGSGTFCLRESGERRFPPVAWGQKPQGFHAGRDPRGINRPLDLSKRQPSASERSGV